MTTTSNRFINGLKKTSAETSVSRTENGAVGYEKTRSAITDFFFAIGSMRSWDEDKITAKFGEAYAENPKLAISMMFLARDCRGGQGEKRLFEVLFGWLSKTDPATATKLLSFIPEYGSWKTFVNLTDSFRVDKGLEAAATDLVTNVFQKDVANLNDESKSVSLIAKWLPSCNASSKRTKELATYWRHVFNLTERDYRQILSLLRKRINVVEKQISDNKWSEVNYNQVPAKANLKYRKAFFKHDAERRQAWIDALKKPEENPEVKINTTGLTIPDFSKAYFQGAYWSTLIADKDDDTVEAAWRKVVVEGQLSDNVPHLIPVIDGSGSMYGGTISNSGLVPANVAMSLGLYLANINKGFWKGQVMSFGGQPRFYQVPTEASFRDQLSIAVKHNDCANTDMESVFDLVLKTAVDNNLRQDEIPGLVIFSDMEFDYAMCNPNENLFKQIAKKWQMAGYKMPKVFFWNINSRTNTIPMQENELGVGLISGFSQSIMDMFLSNKTDPYDLIVEKLTSQRYVPVLQAVGYFDPAPAK